MSKRAEIHIRNLVFPAMLLAASFAAFAETLTGTVVGVADGDTITVLDANRAQHKIRLGGIDAPEKSKSFGQRSKQSMSTLVFGKKVDEQWNKHDRYHRDVPECGGGADRGCGLPIAVCFVVPELKSLLSVASLSRGVTEVTYRPP